MNCVGSVSNSLEFAENQLLYKKCVQTGVVQGQRCFRTRDISEIAFLAMVVGGPSFPTTVAGTPSPSISLSIR